MPNSLKVEFAIKYSAPSKAQELSEALPRWQRATMAVVAREMLLASMRYLDEMRKQNEFVSIRSLFTKLQIENLTQLDVWIPKEDMFEASALTWVKAMEENFTACCQGAVARVGRYARGCLNLSWAEILEVLEIAH